MEKLKKKKKYYFPYKIFNLDNKSKSQPNLFENKISALNIICSNNKKNDEVHGFVKKLKSTILSNKIFSKYMNNYTGQTQDFCFKSPDNLVYPLKKNYQLLPINIRINKHTEAPNNDDSKNYINSNEVNSVIEKPYGFKYKKTKIVIDKDKGRNYYHHSSAEKMKSKIFLSFSEGDYSDELLKAFGLNHIDINNNKEIIKENFEYLNENITKLISLENNTNQKTIEFNIRNFVTKEDIKFNMSVFSLCFNFYEIKKDNEIDVKIIQKQKLYLPFKLLPFFYLLNFTKFKNFLSEIIIYDNETKSMNFNQDKLREKIKKYSFYLRNIYQRKDNENFKDITFYKNEYVYQNNYDWIVINEKDNNNESIIYKLKITFPKVIFEENKNKIKVINHLNKNILIRVLQKCFVEWEKLVLFDLFSNKIFRYLINNILVGGHKYYEKIIKLYENKTYASIDKMINIKNITQSFNNFNKSSKGYEFFISDVKKKESFYYIVIPNTILILSGESKKKFQKINLNLKESRKLYELSNYWGELNTLFKCMYKDEMKNKIYFRLNILEDMPKEIYKTIHYEKINFRDSLIRKTLKNNQAFNLNKEKTNYLRYKSSELELQLFDCLLSKMNINFTEAKLNYYQIPPILLNVILTSNDNMKIVDCITNCYKEIIKNDKEIYLLSEEQNLMRKIYDHHHHHGNSSYEKNNVMNQKQFPMKTINKTKTFFIKTNGSKKNVYHKTLSKLDSFLDNQKDSLRFTIDKKSTLTHKKKLNMNLNNVIFDNSSKLPAIQKFQSEDVKIADKSSLAKQRLSRNYINNI